MRSRWVVGVPLVFLALSLAISYFGLVHRGKAGFQDMERTVVSLVNLSLYLMPAFAVALGYAAVAGERERGSLEVLLAQPVTCVEVVIGKFVGLMAVLTAATVGGFGLPGVLIGGIVGFEGFGAYAFFLITVVMLGATFLGLSLLLSTWASDRSRALVGGLALWFFFVLVFDLLLLGAYVVYGTWFAAGETSASVYDLHRMYADGSGGAMLRTGTKWLSLTLFLNPADVFRMVNLMHLKEVSASLGLAHVAPTVLTHTATYLLVSLVWIVAPVGVAVGVLKRQDVFGLI